MMEALQFNNLEPVKGISGSLISAIAGFNPWRGKPYAYNAIFGLNDERENAAMEWGVRLEPLLARKYVEETGAILFPHMDFGFDFRYPLRHPHIDWWVGTPDRLVLRDPRWVIPSELFLEEPEQAQALIDRTVQEPAFWADVLRGWEAKTAGRQMLPLWGEEGTDTVPEMYICQCAWYLGLTSAFNPTLSQWDLSVLLGGSDFRTYPLFRNLELEGVLLAEAQEFWANHIITRTPPHKDDDPAWKVFFAKVFPRETAPLESATEEEENLFLDLYAARQAKDSYESQVEALQNKLKLRLGERAGISGELSDGRVWELTWKKFKDSLVIDWEGAFNDLVLGLPTSFAEFAAKVRAGHTALKPGPRVFRPSWPKPKKEKKKK